MTQHINLLTRHKSRKGLSWLALWGAGALLIALAIVAVSAEFQLSKLRESEKRAQQTVTDLKAALERKSKNSDHDQSEAMARQMALLNGQINARREWADLLQKGELGNPAGYSQLLETLAVVHVEGVWLQGVDIAKGGQTLSISGKSLNGEAVMRYIAQVNEALKPMGVQFASVEIMQDAASEGAAKAGILNFRIY